VSFLLLPYPKELTSNTPSFILLFCLVFPPIPTVREAGEAVEPSSTGQELEQLSTSGPMNWRNNIYIHSSSDVR
jgi:hypothetical protein